MLRAAYTTFFFRFSEVWGSHYSKNQFDEGVHLAFGDVTLDSCSSPNLVQVKS